MSQIYKIGSRAKLALAQLYDPRGRTMVTYGVEILGLRAIYGSVGILQGICHSLKGKAKSLVLWQIARSYKQLPQFSRRMPLIVDFDSALFRPSDPLQGSLTCPVCLGVRGIQTAVPAFISPHTGREIACSRLRSGLASAGGSCSAVSANSELSAAAALPVPHRLERAVEPLFRLGAAWRGWCVNDVSGLFGLKACVLSGEPGNLFLQ
jgi:hypothetical protein